MNDQFYLGADLSSGAEVQLTGTEAHHLVRVLRKQPGDIVQLFDGRGTAADARIDSIRGRNVQLVIEHVHPATAANGTKTWVAMAPPKGDRFRWAVEKLTELGVDRLIPLATARTVVNPRDHKLEKLKQTVIAACKQCRRHSLMKITPSLKFESLFDQAKLSGLAVTLAHPVVAADSELPSDLANANRCICIGPEGGFTDAELEFARGCGAGLASLGNTILRTETAAVAFAVLRMTAHFA